MWKNIGVLLSGLKTGARTRARQTLELQQMSDRELRDLALGASEIPYVMQARAIERSAAIAGRREAAERDAD